MDFSLKIGPNNFLGKDLDPLFWYPKTPGPPGLGLGPDPGPPGLGPDPGPPGPGPRGLLPKRMKTSYINQISFPMKYFFKNQNSNHQTGQHFGDIMTLNGHYNSCTQEGIWCQISIVSCIFIFIFTEKLFFRNKI